MKAVLAFLAVLTSVLVLEFGRKDVLISGFDVGQTPVTRYAIEGADGPAVVIAHGFAGSQQMMQGYALPLARAGYRVYAFEFLGHGRHTQPMSGDVTAVDGTTGLLVGQTNSVIDAISDGTPVALIGHSMATDVLVRAAETRDDIGPMVLISAFSQVVTATHPARLLLVSGAWEGRLRAFGVEAVHMVDETVAEDEIAIAGAVERKAVAAPFSEHVSILQSRVARAEALAWLDRGFGRASDVTILPTGWAILGLLGGLVLLFGPVARLLPDAPLRQPPLGRAKFATLLIAPAVVAPLVAVPLNPDFLPVLVADYLGLHLLVFGSVQLGLLRFWGVSWGRMAWLPFAVLLVWCALFGFALDRYAANFWPTAGRLWIIVVMLAGTLPFMVADTMLTAQASVLGRFLLRTSLLISLGFAVALDFEGLFFLMLIAPVLVLFFLVFGTLGHSVSRRAGALPAGLALGVVLAWALGVSFPIFQS